MIATSADVEAIPCPLDCLYACRRIETTAAGERPDNTDEHMTEACDILILGTGPFAQRVACDLAATATEPTRVAVAGRNAFRLAWILTAARARAEMFARPVAIEGHEIDLGESGRVAELLVRLRAAVIVQA